MCGKAFIGTIAILGVLLAFAILFLSSPAPAAAQSPTVPDAPATLAFVSGNSKLTVTWDVPASDGGSEITGYTVHYQEKTVADSAPLGDDPSTGWVNANHRGKATEQEITGLVNGTTYQVRVRAKNIGGEGNGSRMKPPQAPPMRPRGWLMIPATASSP